MLEPLIRSVAVLEGDRSAKSLSQGRRWGGLVLSGLPVLFLTFDGVIKLAAIAPVKESFAKLGWLENSGFSIGVIQLVCVALYVMPRTSVFGAVMLTGYLGGAVATHLRVQDPLFSHVLFPTYVGALVWGGLLLREPRLRLLVPVRRGGPAGLCGIEENCQKDVEAGLAGST